MGRATRYGLVEGVHLNRGRRRGHLASGSQPLALLHQSFGGRDGGARDSRWRDWWTPLRSVVTGFLGPADYLR